MYIKIIGKFNFNFTFFYQFTLLKYDISNGISKTRLKKLSYTLSKLVRGCFIRSISNFKYSNMYLGFLLKCSVRIKICWFLCLGLAAFFCDTFSYNLQFESFSHSFFLLNFEMIPFDEMIHKLNSQKK